MRALITENSRVYRQLLDNILGQHGFSNDISDSISYARMLVDCEDYDLICVNQHLADGHGIDFVEYCNHHPDHGRTPIMFLTSESGLDEKQFDARIDVVVQKKNLKQISDQITHFVENRLDPLFSGGRILFVEDSKSIARLILSQLESTGYQITHFTSAEKAWIEFESELAYGSNIDAYDLVITDINVEGPMNGHQLVKEVRSLDDARGFVPVIALTGDDDSRTRLSLFREGVNDYLIKPVMAEELLIRIGNLITNKRLLDKVHDNRRELFELATIDKLTGCHNRNSLMELSEKSISQATRQKCPLSLLVIDLDHFKAINDTHGHRGGDNVLTAVGKLLNSKIKEGDVAARYGGEEFVLLMANCDSTAALERAEQIRQAMESLRPNGITVTCSIGLTSYDGIEDASFESLFLVADKGVYQAKENGRNQVVCVPLE